MQKILLIGAKEAHNKCENKIWKHIPFPEFFAFYDKSVQCWINIIRRKNEQQHSMLYPCGPPSHPIPSHPTACNDWDNEARLSSFSNQLRHFPSIVKNNQNLSPNSRPTIKSTKNISTPINSFAQNIHHYQYPYMYTKHQYTIIHATWSWS